MQQNSKKGTQQWQEIGPSEFLNILRDTKSSEADFPFQELKYLFGDDLSQEEAEILFEFESMFFGLPDKHIKYHSLDLQRPYPLLTNSFNIFMHIFDRSKNKQPKNGKCHFLMENFIEQVDFNQFMKVIQILDKQKPMIRYLRTYPLYRE